MVTLKYQERFRTDKGVFDEFTKRNLFMLESRGCYDEPLRPLKIGKESNVFMTQKGRRKLIVKIYRLQNCDFNKMYQYIRQDPRYAYLKKNRRQIIFAWTMREFKNLHKAHKNGLNVPQPLHFLHNILIEEMIGAKNPALPLKDDPPKNPRVFFSETIEQVSELFAAGLVHGDLSSFNILNYNEHPYLIDFSQTTISASPNSRELLERDVGNLVRYFEKLGVKTEREKIIEKIITRSNKSSD